VEQTSALIALALGLGVFAVVPVLLRWLQRKDALVLGQHLAAADTAEQRRKQRGDMPKSPMPDGTYDFWRGEQSLIGPTQNSLDSALREFCRAFAEADEDSRARIRESISTDEFYTLLMFSKRAAVFAMREQNVDWVVNGLTAVAMVEQERTDFRDILWALGVLYHSAKRIGDNPDILLRNAAAISEPNVSELILGFIRRSPTDKNLQSSWGYDEVQTANGIGLIGRSFSHYEPACDLKTVALEIADYVASDKYQPESVEIATALPAFWLESKATRDLNRILRAVSGAASINARLRPNEHPGYESQMLLVFVVEAENEAAAGSLLEMCDNKKSSDYSMVGMAEGRLFCVVVARSFVGAGSFETSQSLSRFPRGISPILRQHACNL
jgi:hypothetical protein